MSPLNRKLVRDMNLLRGQLIAVAAVVASGVTTYVMMGATYATLSTTQMSYYTAFRFADVFVEVRRAPESLRNELALIPGVSAVQTRVVRDVVLDVPGLAEPATAHVVSVPDIRAPMLNDLHILAGRYITYGAQTEVIASDAFAKANGLHVGDSLGAVVNGRWKRVCLVGIALSPEYVIEIRPGSILMDNKRYGVFWMSRSAMSAAFDMEGAFNDATLTITRGAVVADVIDHIDAMMDRYGSMGAYARADQSSHMLLSDEIKQTEVMARVVPTIFLAVAAFLLNIVLLRLVGTQREQIAILKAFGYSTWSIGLHYLGFAVVAVLAGSVAGILLGSWLGVQLAGLYMEFYRFPILRFNAPLSVISIAVISSLLAACIGAVSAVRSAMALPPAQAMRPQSPPRFRPGIVERLGFQRYIAVPVRLIVRNIERRPWKSFIATSMIALAIAILMLGRFFSDAVDKVTDLQFNVAERADATVVFNLPRPSSTQNDLRHLPGVLRSETYRFVAARVSHGYRSKRLAVTGLPEQSSLKRVITLNRGVSQVPPDGVLISSWLSDLLAAAPGDTLRVEILEGRKPVLMMPVQATVDDMLGLNVYMSTEALNRALGEEGTISAASLSVDPRDAGQLYETLKRTPAVGATVFRDASIKSFKDMEDRSLLVTTMWLIGLACVIAFGVVYNSARIALSERGHELASLRVLGFTKAEITLILLGEQALLIAAALPLGFLFGSALILWMPSAFNSDLLRFPGTITKGNFVFAALVVVVTGMISAVIVRQRLYNLDLVAVLKSRE